MIRCELASTIHTNVILITCLKCLWEGKVKVWDPSPREIAMSAYSAIIWPVCPVRSQYETEILSRNREVTGLDLLSFPLRGKSWYVEFVDYLVSLSSSKTIWSTVFVCFCRTMCTVSRRIRLLWLQGGQEESGMSVSDRKGAERGFPF
jgi:hypothetical protein